MNLLVTGDLLRKHVSGNIQVSMTQFVGQIVSTGTPHKDLSGPVLGKRVGVFFSSSPEGPWTKLDGHARMPGEAVEQSEGPKHYYIGDDAYQLNLFSVTPGCFDETTEHDNSSIHTVPRSVNRKLGEMFRPSSDPISMSLPMEAIPEEVDAVIADDIRQHPHLHRPAAELADELPLPEDGVDDPKLGTR